MPDNGRVYRIDGPAQICFSGGRTSAFMLHQILATCGGLPPDCLVTFENTGKEREETLVFIETCAQRWQVPIHWLEWDGFIDGQPQRFCRYREVTFSTAARHGEPFAAMTRASGMLPNPVARLCTVNLKVRTGAAFMRAQGLDTWDNVIGIRADEPGRAARMRSPKHDDTYGTSVLPLVRANVTKADVLAFWRAQPFDLQLDPQGYLGNCDLCFLKSHRKLVCALVDEPERADWWIEQEALSGNSTFRNDRPPYRELRREAAFYARQIPLDFDATADDDALIDCFCGDG